MQTPCRMLVLVLGLALLVGLPSAYQFNATVVNEIGTRLVNTHVQIMVGNTVLYENATTWCPEIDVAKGCYVAYDRAMSSFDLAPGIYFVRLQRGGYPDHAYILNITRDLEVQYVMFIKKSTYTLFGRVTGNPEHWTGTRISMMDAQDTVVRSANILPAGDFLIDTVWPDTNYYLRLDDGTQRINSPVFQAPDTGAGYMEVNGTLALSNNTILAPKLAASSGAALYSVLSVQLKSGDRPMTGQQIAAKTPRGTLNLSTDENGKVYVQAAEGGEYTFTWETQVVKMSVPKPTVAAPPQKNETPAAPVVIPTEQPAETAPQGGMTWLGMASLLLFVMMIVIAVVFIFFVVPWFMKALNKPVQKKEEPAAPMWPMPAEPQAETGAKEHGRKEAHAHHKHKAAKHHKKKR